MTKRKNEAQNRSQVERLVDIMFSDSGVPAESLDKMRTWLVDPDREEEKSDALYDKFLEEFRFNPEPVLAPQMWPDLARRLGLDEAVVIPTVDPLAPGGVAGSAVEEEVEEGSDSAGFEENAAGVEDTAGAHSVAEAQRQEPQEPQQKPQTPAPQLKAQQQRRFSFRRVAPRVAAILIPALVVVGAALWIADRRSHQPNLVEISVPAGAVQTIVLPDGSRVEAEPGAVVAYDEKSFAVQRTVKLTGEALFDVAGSADASGGRVPFAVETEHLTVNVLGTIFRLTQEQGAEGSDAAAVSLYKGSVGVTIGPDNAAGKDAEKDAGKAAVAAEMILSAGERLTVNTATGEHTTALIPASEMAEQGVMPLLKFYESSLGDLVMALEMNHGVAFVVAEGIDLAGGRYSADFEGVALDVVLEMLSRIDTNLSFERSADGEEVNVKKK